MQVKEILRLRKEYFLDKTMLIRNSSTANGVTVYSFVLPFSDRIYQLFFMISSAASTTPLAAGKND